MKSIRGIKLAGIRLTVVGTAVLTLSSVPLLRGVNLPPCDPCVITMEPKFWDRTPTAQVTQVGQGNARGVEVMINWRVPAAPVGTFKCGTQDESIFNGFTVPGSVPPQRYFVPKMQSKWITKAFSAYYLDPCKKKSGRQGPSDMTLGWAYVSGGGGGDPGPGGGGTGGGDPNNPNPPNPPGDPEEPGEGDGYDEPEEDKPCPPVNFVPEQCSYENPDSREKPELEDAKEIEFISEVIYFSHQKSGFPPYTEQDEDENPKFYLKETINTQLQGGNPESPVGGSQVREICRMGGNIIITDQDGNPSFYGFRSDPDATVTETTYDGSFEISSYDDCPNHEDDEDATMHVTGQLSDEYSTDMMKDDAFDNDWNFKDYYEQTVPTAHLDIAEDEASISFSKVQYRVRVPEKYKRPILVGWVEEFTPEDDNPDDEIEPEKEYVFKSEQIQGEQSGPQTIDPSADGGEKEGTWRVYLVDPDAEALARDPSTGDYRSMGAEVSEIDPSPELKMTVSSVQRVGDNYQVAVNATFRDIFGEIPGTSKFNTAQFYQDGNVVATVSGLASGGSGGVAPWQTRNSTQVLSHTYTVPVGATLSTLTVRTNANASGDFGFDSALFALGSDLTPAAITVPAANKPVVHISGSFSPSAIDVVGVQFPGQVAATLTESAADSLYFAGSANVAGVATAVGLAVGTMDPIRTTHVDTVNANLALSGGTTASYKIFMQETGASTGDFNTTDAVGAIGGAGQIGEKVNKEANTYSAGKNGPFVVRVQVPEYLADLLEEGSKVKFVINGLQVPVGRVPGFVPGESEDTSNPYLYVLSGAQPRVFALEENSEGSEHSPTGVFADEEFIVGIRKVLGSQKIWEHSFGVVYDTPVSYPVLVPGSAPASFEQQTQNFYHLLFGEYGQRLLTAAQQGGSTIVFERIYGDLDNWEVDDHLAGAYTAGKRPRIRIDKYDIKNPVGGAFALYSALYHLFHFYGTSPQITALNPPKDLPPGMDPEEAAIFDELTRARFARMGSFLSDASSAAEFGLCLLSEPLDWVMTTTEAADDWKDGRKAVASVRMGVMLLPGGLRMARETGLHFSYKLPDGRLIRLSHNLERTEVYEALDHIIKGERIEGMRKLRPLLESGAMTSDDIVDLWEIQVLTASKTSGKSPYKLLEDGIFERTGQRPGLGEIRQHDLVVANGGKTGAGMNLELEFLKRGLDPNDGTIAGRLLPKDFHDNVIHGGKKKVEFGSGGAWNYQWKMFFTQEGAESLTATDVLEFMEELVTLTSDPAIKSVWDVNWPFPLQ